LSLIGPADRRLTTPFLGLLQRVSLLGYERIVCNFDCRLMRYMLPITVPKDRDNIWLNVNGLRYTWTEAEGVLWDDTYPHAVYNRTEEVRIILYMDVLRHKNMPKIAAMINATTVRILKLAGLADDEIKKTEVTVKI